MGHVLKKIGGITMPLSACPFCGNAPEWVEVVGEDYIMRCSVCHASTGKARMTPEEAAADWQAGKIKNKPFSIIEDVKIDEYLTNGIKNILFSCYLFDQFPQFDGGFLCSNAVILAEKTLRIDVEEECLFYDEVTAYGQEVYTRPITEKEEPICLEKSDWHNDLLRSLTFRCGDKRVRIAPCPEYDCLAVYEE